MMRDELGGRPSQPLQAGASWTLAPGQLAFVLSGFLVVTLDGHMDRLLAADGLVGIEQGVVTTLRALTDAEVLFLDFADILSGSESPAVLDALRVIAETRVRSLVRQRSELERNLDDFLDPVHGGFAPPPYTATHARLVLAVLRDPSLAAELPAPLRPVPGVEDRVLMVWSHYPDIGPPGGPSAAYEEAALFIPCIDPGGGGPGLYCPALFPESMMAILTGREGFKFPKRFGNVIVEPRHAYLDAGDMQALMAWSGERDLPDGSWVEEVTRALLGEGWATDRGSRLAGALGALGLRRVLKTHTPLPLYVRNRVGQDNGGRTDWTIDELVWVPFDLGQAHVLRSLEAAQFQGHGRLAFARFEGAWEAVVDLELRAGAAVHDLRRTPRARIRQHLLRAGVRRRRLWSLLRS